MSSSHTTNKIFFLKLFSTAFFTIFFIGLSICFRINVDPAHAEFIGGKYHYYLPLIANDYDNFHSYVVMQNGSGQTATVTLNVYDSNGNSTNINYTGNTVPPMGGVAPNGIFVPNTVNTFYLASNGSNAPEYTIQYKAFQSNTQLSGFITSDQPLSVLVTVGNGYSLASSAYNAIIVPNNNVVIPYAYKSYAGGFYTSFLDVTNVSNFSTNVTVKYYKNDGSNPGSISVIVPPMGKLFKDYNDLFINQNLFNITDGDNGWFAISSDNGANLVSQVGQGRQRDNVNGLDGYYSFLNGIAPNQFNSTGNSQYLPGIYNHKFGNLGGGGFTTGTNYVNPTNSTESVNVQYYNLDGTSANYNNTFSINPLHVVNIYDSNTMPNGFEGYGIVTASGQGLVTGTNFGTDQDKFGSYTGIYKVTGDPLTFPITDKGGYGTVTGLSIINVGSQTTSGTIKFYYSETSSGHTTGDYSGYSINFGPLSQGQGTDIFLPDQVALLQGFKGSAKVETNNGGSLIAVANNQQTDNNGNVTAFYNYTEPNLEYSPIREYSESISIFNNITFNTLYKNDPSPNVQALFLKCNTINNDPQQHILVNWAITSQIQSPVNLTVLPNSGSFYCDTNPPVLKAIIGSNTANPGSYSGSVDIDPSKTDTPILQGGGSAQVIVNIIDLVINPKNLNFYKYLDGTISPSSQNVTITCSGLNSYSNKQIFSWHLGLDGTPSNWVNLSQSDGFVSCSGSSVVSVTIVNANTTNSPLNQNVHLNFTGAYRNDNTQPQYVTNIKLDILDIKNNITTNPVKINAIKDKIAFTLNPQNCITGTQFKITEIDVYLPLRNINNVLEQSVLNIISVNGFNFTQPDNSNNGLVKLSPSNNVALTSANSCVDPNVNSNPTAFNIIMNTNTTNNLRILDSPFIGYYILKGGFDVDSYNSHNFTSNQAQWYSINPPAWYQIADSTSFSRTRYEGIVKNTNNKVINSNIAHWITNIEDTSPFVFANPNNVANISMQPFSNSSVLIGLSALDASLKNFYQNCPTIGLTCSGNNGFNEISSYKDNIIQNYSDSNVSSLLDVGQIKVPTISLKATDFQSSCNSSGPSFCTQSYLDTNESAPYNIIYQIRLSSLTSSSNGSYSTYVLEPSGFPGGYAPNILIIDDITNNNQKNGIILYLKGAHKITVENTLTSNITNLLNDTQNDKSSALVITDTPVIMRSIASNRGNNLTQNFVNYFNIGVVTSDSVNYICGGSYQGDPPYDLTGKDNDPLYQVHNGCRTVQSGLVFAQKDIYLNYSNPDSYVNNGNNNYVYNPTLKITYNPNYIVDFKNIFANTSYVTEYLGLNF